MIQNTDMGQIMPSDDSDPDTIELKRLISALWHRKFLIAAFTLGVAALFFLMISRVTPLYTSRASLMLDPRSVQILSSDSVVSDLNLNNPLLDTEAAVLQSNMLLADVVTNLGAETLAPIDPARQEPGVSDKLKSSIKSGLNSLINKTTTADPPLTEEEKKARDLRRLTSALRRVMTVRREGQSYLIAVATETPDPKLSQLIANTVIETYIQQQIDLRNKSIRDATAFLTARIEDMRQRVQQAESRIEDFRTKQVAETGTTAETAERQLLELSTQLAIAQADLAQVKSRYDRIQAVIERDGIERAAELLTSPFILSLRQRISDANRRAVELATRFSEGHPERVAAQAEIDQLIDEMAQEVRQTVATLENDVAVASARVKSMRTSVEDMEARVALISRNNVALRQLEREADALRQTYQEMLSRLSETRSTEQLQRADARQVERAMPPGSPSSPRVILFTMFGATLGFALGLVLTFFLTVSQSGFTSAREIERTLGLSLTTSLLRKKLRSPRALLKLLRTHPYGAFAERLRQLRMVMMVQHDKTKGGMCIQMTSSLANESKTSTTLALAYLEARANRRCVILDFDLRRSSLGRDFKYDAACDLADVLTGRGRLSDAIMPVGSLGFDLITVKKPAPQLGDQFDILQVQAILDRLRREYDLILVDSAPLLLVSDSLRLAPLFDAVVLLIRQKSTRRKAAIQSARVLKEVGAKSIFVAMTFTDRSSEEDTYGAYIDYN